MAYPSNKGATECLIQAQESPPKTKPHLPAIDGLRGLAAMMVVFFHCWGMNGFLASPQFSLIGTTVPLYRAFSPGYSGVYLFFVLSGFCLAYPFLSNPERGDNWPVYAMNRVRRILPPYLLSFLILFLIGQWLHHAQIGPSDKFLYERFQTNKFIKELFLIRKSHIVNSYWTLVLEWRWYLFFPALLLLVRRISPPLMVVALYGIAYLAQKPVLANYLATVALGPLITCLPMFAMGIWAAHITALKPEALHAWERWIINHSLWGVVASSLWCAALRPSAFNPSLMNFSITWGPFYFFLILAALNHPWFKKTFSSRPFVKLGVISYSIYLLQEPVILAGHFFIDRPNHGNVRLLFTHYLLMPILCILAGWIFHLVGERPFMKRSAKQSISPK